MARIRSVHPDICVSETMAGLCAELERTFVRLWTHCDDEGRCKDNPRLIKAAIYPLHDKVDVAVLDAELDELWAAGILVRYEVAGDRFIQVTSWSEFQKPQRPTPSKYPPPPNPSALPQRKVAEEYASDTRGLHAGVEVGEGVGASPPATDGDERDPFDAWWQEFPRKTGKVDARKAFVAALKAGASVDQLVEAARNVALRPDEYQPHPTTVLRAERWRDWLDDGAETLRAKRNGAAHTSDLVTAHAIAGNPDF